MIEQEYERVGAMPSYQILQTIEEKLIRFSGRATEELRRKRLRRVFVER